MAERPRKLIPMPLEVQKILGDIYETQKDYEQAIRAYKRALELDSNDVNSMKSLAIAYLENQSQRACKGTS